MGRSPPARARGAPRGCPATVLREGPGDARIRAGGGQGRWPATRPIGGADWRAPRDRGAANRSWWDAEAADYFAEHGSFLGPGARRLRLGAGRADVRSRLGLLGEVTGRRGARGRRGGSAVLALAAGPRGRSLSWPRMLARGMLPAGPQPRPEGWAIRRRAWRSPSYSPTRPGCPSLTRSFDVAFSAYGAVPFVADSAALMRRWRGSCGRAGGSCSRRPTPFRWAFPDDPGPGGLRWRRILLRPHALRGGRLR